MIPITISNFQFAINVALSDHLQRPEHCLVLLAVRFTRHTACAPLMKLLGEEGAGVCWFLQGQMDAPLETIKHLRTGSPEQQGVPSCWLHQSILTADPLAEKLEGVHRQQIHTLWEQNIYCYQRQWHKLHSVSQNSYQSLKLNSEIDRHPFLPLCGAACCVGSMSPEIALSSAAWALYLKFIHGI